MRNDVHYTPAHWTKGQAEADYKNQPAIRVTVNDRAATRQAIITSVKHQQVDFYERSDWGAHKAKPVGLENDWDYTKIAIHMAGRSYSCGKPDLKMEEIQEAHQKKWPDIGYHYAVSCAGEIFEGRDIRFKGAHLLKFNTGVIGIVLLQNLSEPEESKDIVGIVKFVIKVLGEPAPINIPHRQRHGLKVLIKALQEFFNIAELGGHREFPQQDTTEARLCPGTHGMELVNELRSWSALAKPSAGG